MFSLLTRLKAYQENQQPCVLATLIDSQGSTYRKPGARMVIDLHGNFFGLLSGGCFEADIQLHAEQVIASGKSKLVEYDLLSEDDVTWGMGAGCKGAIKILLQPLLSDQSFAPFIHVHRLLAESKPAQLVTVLLWQKNELVSAVSYFFEGKQFSESSLPSEVERIHIDSAFEDLNNSRNPCVLVNFASATKNKANNQLSIVAETIKPPTHLMILGAGIDALPLVKSALALGWQVTIADHRKYNLGLFADLSVNFIKCRSTDLEKMSLIAADALVIMSHHFESDGHYLRMARAHSAHYVGLLGPGERRNELFAEHNFSEAHFGERLYSPIGLDIGAETPEEIALSIIAEINSVLKVSSGQSLRLKSRGIHE